MCIRNISPSFSPVNNPTIIGAHTYKHLKVLGPEKGLAVFYCYKIPPLSLNKLMDCFRSVPPSKDHSNKKKNKNKKKLGTYGLSGEEELFPSVKLSLCKQVHLSSASGWTDRPRKRKKWGSDTPRCCCWPAISSGQVNHEMNRTLPYTQHSFYSVLLDTLFINERKGASDSFQVLRALAHIQKERDGMNGPPETLYIFIIPGGPPPRWWCRWRWHQARWI